MATKDDLIRAYNQLARESAAAYADAQDIIKQGTGPNPLYGNVTDSTGRTTVKGSGSIYAEFGLTPPGRLPSKALSDRLSQDLAVLVQNRTAMGQIYSALHPSFELSPAEFIGILVAMIATAGAASALAGAGAGAAGAGAGAATAGTTAGTAGAATGAATAAEAGTAGTLATVTVSAPAIAAGTGAALTPTLATIGVGGALSATAASLSSASSALSSSGLTQAAASAASTASTASSLAGYLGKGVTALTGSSTAGSVVSDLVSGAGSLISDLKDYLGPLVTFAEKVLSEVEQVNNGIIKPLSDTVLKDYTTISGLIGEVHELAHSGIKGILAIPDALASAFSSLDAANARLAQALGVINAKTASDILVPGIGGAVAKPLGDIHSLLNDAWGQPVPDVGNLQPIQLDESLFKYDDLITKFNAVTGKLKDTGFVGKALAVLVEGFNDILGFLASTENLVEIAKQKGNQLLPVEPLGIEEVIDAWWKDHFDEQTAMLELARHGIDETRAKALYILKEWLPDPETAVRLFYRGQMNSDELKNALKRQGYSDPDIAAVTEGALEPLNPQEAIQVAGRIAAASEGFLKDSLGSAPPDDIKLLYPPRLARADRANFDWISRWNIRDISWWITGWFRGVVSNDELKLAAKSFNIPDELVPHLAQIEAGTIQLWMIPDLLAENVLDDNQARDYLHYIGIGDKDTEIMIQYGKIKANKAKGPDPLGLAAISEGNAKAMLEDGIINSAEFVEILVAHGYSNQAAALTAQLAEQQLDLQARRNFANSVLLEFEQGLITLEDMQTKLRQEGFTEKEVESYTAQAETGLLKRAKKPSLADVEKFIKAGIVTADQALAILVSDGWSEFYATAFLTLWGVAPQAPNS